jgi:LmbE family N-acetylglucosaminyl deacetylase
MNNLIVAAHPDDEILGCGGVIGRFHSQEDFHVLILTDGAAGRYDEVMSRELRDQALAANRMVGTRSVHFENLPNQGLDHIALSEVIAVIERHLHRIRPTRLFIHSHSDLNKDHRIAFEAAVTAVRPLAGQVVRQVYTYFVASSSEWDRTDQPFVPNTFVDVAGSLDLKCRAMSCYTIECRPYPHPRSCEAVAAYAGYWGLTAGFRFAEPFRLIQQLDVF